MPHINRAYFVFLVAWGLMLCGCAMVLLLANPSMLDGNGHYYGLDFLNYWAGPQIAAQDVMLLFDRPRYHELQQALYGTDIAFYNWSYPLHLLPLLTPLTWLAPLPAYLLWSFSGLTFYLFVVWRGSLKHKRRALLLALFAPATILNFFYGQNGFFTAAWFLGALIYEQHKPLHAGIFLGLLTTKPQLGFVWPIYLLMKQRWRVIAMAGVTAALLIGLSLALYGVDAWREYFTTVADYQMQLLDLPPSAMKTFQVTMPTLPMALQKMGMGHDLAFQWQWNMSVVVIVLLIRALRKSNSFSQTALLLASAAMLVTPYLFTYDMTVMSGALIWHLVAQHALSRPQKIIYGAGYLLPALVYWLYFLLPIAPFITLSVFLLTVSEE